MAKTLPLSPLTSEDRLAALARTELLDSAGEPYFDRIAQLATRLLRSQTGLVSLVTPEKQFFLSACGLAEPYATTRETPLSHSFCKHVIQSGQPLAVPDARKMLLVASNSAVTELNVISYLGIPILGRGETLGALCVINDAPREWTTEDVEVLSELAHVLEDEIGLRELAIKASGLAEENATLAREYHHRVKNALAVSSALVTLSARDAVSVADLESKTRGRLTALASAHDSLMSASDHVELEDLTNRLLQPYVAADARPDIAGPPVILRNHQITPMCLILHELATNSTKYGAFGDHGKISVRWTYVSGGRICLTWTETVSKTPDTSATNGFGSVLLEVAARQLRGTCETVWTDQKLIVTVTFPTAS